MKVLNVVAARSTWLFDVADLNPKGKSLFPELIDWLKDNYHFKKAPESAPKEDDNNGLAGEHPPFQRAKFFRQIQMVSD